MYYLYVLESKSNKKSYVGITSNLKKRVGEHNNGKGTFTKKYKPWKLVYKEELNSRIEARKREKYFKSASGRRYLKKKIFRE